MTPSPPARAEPPPSWLPPIAMGATFALFAQLAPLVVADLVPAVQVALCCCCAAQPVPIGVLPAWLAARRDRRLTPGQGFAVAFIAAGLGSVTVAFVQFMAIRGTDTEAWRESFVSALNKAREAGGGSELTREQVESLADSLVEFLPLFPAIVATLITLLAALVGMVTVRVMRRGEPAPAPPV